MKDERIEEIIQELLEENPGATRDEVLEHLNVWGVADPRQVEEAVAMKDEQVEEIIQRLLKRNPGLTREEVLAELAVWGVPDPKRETPPPD